MKAKYTEVIAMNFGEWVKTCRESLGKSQVDFARLYNGDAGGLGRIERGEHKPQASTIWAMAAALCVPFHLLRQLAERRAVHVPIPTADMVELRRRQIEDGVADLQEHDRQVMDAGRWLMGHANELMQLFAPPALRIAAKHPPESRGTRLEDLK